MEYKADFDAETFGWWSGARDTIKDIKNAGKMEELKSHIEDVFYGDTPTETQINDYVWYERDTIFNALGLDEDGNPIDEDEDEEDEE